MKLFESRKQKSDLAVYVMTHGPECTWLANYCIPLEIGAACRENHCCELRDDMGADNISKKDKLYCELTGLYWMWKNDTHDYVGLYHYRRVFTLSSRKIHKYLSRYDIILPKKISMSPTVDTEHSFSKIPLDWDILKEVLEEMYPEYYESAKRVFPMTKSFAYNMFITTHSLFNDYCQWLFPLLQEIERRFENNDERYTQYLNEREKQNYIPGYYERAIGFISERLIHIYVEHHQLIIKEVPLQFISLSSKYPKFISEIITSNLSLYNITLKIQDFVYSNIIKH